MLYYYTSQVKSSEWYVSLLHYFILNLRHLAKVETGLIHGAPNVGAILKALAVRIFFVIFAAVIQWER